MDSLKIIGTSHIAKQSIDEITRTFKSYDPDIVCVELDPKRLHALMTDAKPDYSLAGIKRYGLQGYLFAVIGGFIQKKLGNVVGTKPGSDMLTAVNLSRINKKQLMLVDQDIEITLKRFSKQFTFKDKMKLLWDIIKSPFGKKIKINLNEVPKEKIIEQMIGQIRERYPSLYGVLIHSANDAAYVLADNYGEKKFVELMNKKAEDIRMNHTHFSNSTGFDDWNNYSTPFDLALAARRLLNNPYLAKVVAITLFLIIDKAIATCLGNYTPTSIKLAVTCACERSCAEEGTILLTAATYNA